MVPFAHASDGGGSIRIPASVCGLVGLKPSRQRLYVNQPVEGPDLSVRLAVTRSVRDTAQILNVAENKSAAPIDPVGFVAGPSTRRLKIAFSTTSMLGTPAAPDVRAAIEKTAQLCADMGHEVENVEASVARPEFARQFMNVWANMADGVVQAAWMIGLSQGRLVRAKHVLEPWTMGLSQFYRANLAKDDQIMSKAMAGFQRLAQDYASFFETYDVQLTPTLRQPPALIGTLDTSDSFEEHYEAVLDYVGYTPQHNAAGIPAITLPLFTSRKGLPIGSMFGAKYGDERTLLELAYELEEAAPWANRWPEISDQYI
jgi:amidase